MSLPWSIDIETIGVPGGAGGPCLLMMPHRADSQDQPLADPGQRRRNAERRASLDTDPAIGVARHEWEFRCETRAERRSSRTGSTRAKGKREPFWFPTWQWELDLRGYTAPLHRAAVGRALGNESYADDFYPLSIAYRKILSPRARDYKVHTVTSVTPNVATGVDLLGLNNNGTGSRRPADGGRAQSARRHAIDRSGFATAASIRTRSVRSRSTATARASSASR
jgi:hypothetical protein